MKRRRIKKIPNIISLLNDGLLSITGYDIFVLNINLYIFFVNSFRCARYKYLF